MARYYVPQLSEFPYHVTARCPNRDPFPLSLEEVWKLSEDHLSLAHYKHGLKIHCFVLMPNHFHLICSVDQTSIGKVMSELLGNWSKEMNFKAAKINQNWGARHHKSVLGKYHYMINAYKYVYQNPLRAGLCRYSEEWPFSTLHGLLGLSKLNIPMEPDEILFNPEFNLDELKWLNRLPDDVALAAFRKALQKREFRLPKVKRVHLHELEHDRL